jgi:NO-binding membrane sensor protein with MHYT domain/nitrogen-specific signal transduction histidine kinase
MFRVYTCITQQHDPQLVLAALAICLLACYTAFSLLPRAALAAGRARLWWICATATVIGSGTWATHFIAMLAFEPAVPVGHDATITALSILVAIILTGVGVGVAVAVSGGIPRRLAGGAVVGLGIAAMQYTGMAAWELQGTVVYDARFVTASVLIGTVGSSLTIALGTAKVDAAHRLSATLVLFLAICGMHFTGIAAATIRPNPAMLEPSSALPHAVLAIGIAAVTVLILALGLAGAILDERLASHFAREAAALKAEVEQRSLAQAALQRHHDELERAVAARTAALAVSEARLAEAIETLPETFALFDADDRLVVCNALYRSLSGTMQEYAKPGISFVELVTRAVECGDIAIGDEEKEAWIARRVEQHRSAGTRPVKSELHRSDGRWNEIYETRLSDGCIVMLQLDVTEIRSRMEKLADRDKLTALGQLAGGVAHEINNLLQPALVYPELIREVLPPEDAETRELLDVMEDGVRKARDIVRNVLTYARKEEAALQQGDLAQATAAALKFIRGLLPPGILLQDPVTTENLPAVFNQTELTQVLSNLVLNAAHASGQRGTIEVSLVRALPSGAAVLKHGLAPGARYAMLSVLDHGTGMDAATVARIFEPFFTTKPLGVGTGLGLSVVLGIVRSWNGAIDVESAPSKGTCFTLYIPTEPSSAAGATGDSPGPLRAAE